jgi:alanyl-tRNA synthetase
MRASELRQKFLNFFESKGHKVIPSAPLIPENDPTVLFTTAGMHPLVPYLLGQPHPLGKRLTSVQKCIRTVDIEEVGDDTHLTFFEMLGNWSLGDYFKEEAIEWSFEFLTKELGIPLERLAISVFAGDELVPRDEESAGIWEKLGVKKERIAYLGREDNWWGPAGKTGPCGPDTEMFYWCGGGEAPEIFDPADERWVEIWNDVFMEYEKTEEGKFLPLRQKNVDTGMGLERTLAALNGKSSVFETELFLPLMELIDSFAVQKKPLNSELPKRIIADHIKAATFILAERLEPSNLERGYVLRRLIRRAKRQGRLLGIDKIFTPEIGEAVIKIYQADYPELKKEKEFILEQLKKEEEAFSKVLTKGLKMIEKIETPLISGKEAFDLYQSYGFPIEMTQEIAKEKGIKVDVDGFHQEFKKHQELSRQAAQGRFKSGLADHSKEVIRYHTATHLLHQALREILGKEVRQMGSNITKERLRFDFSFPRKLTPEEIKKVEDLVNQKIKEKLEVKREELPLTKALGEGALAFFKERYPELVSVYTIYDKKSGKVFSKEICAGPHVKNTSELGKFKIKKEEALGKGVRRIRAVLE